MVFCSGFFASKKPVSIAKKTKPWLHSVAVGVVGVAAHPYGPAPGVDALAHAADRVIDLDDRLDRPHAQVVHVLVDHEGRRAEAHVVGHVIAGDAGVELVALLEVSAVAL